MHSPFGNSPTTRHRGETRPLIQGLIATFHQPLATESRFVGGVEQAQQLARYAPVELFKVDDFPGCPAHWQRSGSNVGVYFMKAMPGHMVWIDLNANSSDSHDVAAIFSAQGVNGLTCQKVDGAKMEQFQNDCPEHNTPFTNRGGKKWCDACNHDWPDNNYLATTSVGIGEFWRDGWRGKDGLTREFVFTDKAEEGVATHIIGDERINAFGVALFRSRHPKPRPAYNFGGRGGSDELLGGTRSMRSPQSFSAPDIKPGALVHQTVGRDSKRLDHWNVAPDAIFVVYFVFEEEFQRILGTGTVHRGQEGSLPSTVPVGHQ